MAEAKEAQKESKRRTYRNDEWTEEEVKAKRAELTVEEAPPNWVKVSEVADACREEGVPISKFVRAFGSDRGMSPPADPIFAFVYVGRTRYVSNKVLTQGMKLLKDPEFLKTTRKKKAKAEDAETGKVKSAKSGRKVAVRPAK
jgi:hypothetical protein